MDTVLDSTEGMNVGWITAGEWLEYSVDVKRLALTLLILDMPVEILEVWGLCTLS